MLRRMLLFVAAISTSLLMETVLSATLLLVVFSETLQVEHHVDPPEAALFLLPLVRIDAILFGCGSIAAT